MTGVQTCALPICFPVTIPDFIQVFQNIQKSPFLRGETGWMGCGFDWVFKKTNFQKILEGNYNG